MSNLLTSQARIRNLNVGYSAKSILLLMADFANDDGSGIYASKPTMAKQLETSKQTIIRGIKCLEKSGLVSAIGTKSRGVVEYQIHVPAILSCPEHSPDQSRSVTGAASPPVTERTGNGATPVTERYPKGNGALPDPVTERYPNQKEPKRTCARAQAVTHFGVQPVERAEAWADVVRDKGFIPRHLITIQTADAMVFLELVSRDELRDCSIQFSDQIPERKCNE